MTHADMDDLYELYALGALELDQAVEIDKHVTDHCDYCLKHIQDAVTSTAMLSGMQDATEPPSRVRQRLMASIAQPKVARRGFNWIVPVFATACIVLFGVSVWSWVSLEQTGSRLTAVSRERRQLREALEVLSSSQPTLVHYGKSGQPSGTVFFNQSGGFVVIGSRLPEIASDKIFELWVIPKKGAPIPAGLFRGEGEAHSFVHAYSEPINVGEVGAVAVTVEPKEGSVAPTTKPFLVVPIG